MDKRRFEVRNPEFSLSRNHLPFPHLCQRRKLQNLAYVLKGEEEDNCGNLQRICFNFCLKGSKTVFV